jgi:hypothetical protein
VNVGHELFYQPGDHHVGSVSLRRWEEVSKLLPLLVDFVNRATHQEWRPGVVRDVRVFEGGGAVPAAPPPDHSQPTGGPFALTRMLSEEFLGRNEVHIFQAAEWDRLFEWCDFLSERDGAYALYQPLVEVLRSRLAGLDVRD